MGWGRIDDRFDDHQKVIDLLEYDQGAAAIGLWTLCFTWAHRNTRKPGKTPGLIPSSLPRRYVGPIGRELAGLLVKVGLWEERGEDGWLFHDFDQYLPTEHTREARADAGRKGAEKRWGSKRGSRKQTDSKLPSGDAKLPGLDGKPPEASYDADSNAVANDGSRAPARRAISKEIAIPLPEPVPPTAGADEPRRPPNVGDVVAAFVSGATEAGLNSPPASLKARVGKQARELIAQGWDADFLVGSAHRMGATEFNDLAVQARKDDAAVKIAGNGRDSPPDRREQAQQARASRALERARAREGTT